MLTARDKKGRRVLHYAVRHAAVSEVRTLLDYYTGLDEARGIAAMYDELENCEGTYRCYYDNDYASLITEATYRCGKDECSATVLEALLEYAEQCESLSTSLPSVLNNDSRWMDFPGDLKDELERRYAEGLEGVYVP